MTEKNPPDFSRVLANPYFNAEQTALRLAQLRRIEHPNDLQETILTIADAKQPTQEQKQIWNNYWREVHVDFEFQERELRRYLQSQGMRSERRY